MIAPATPGQQSVGPAGAGPGRDRGGAAGPLPGPPSRRLQPEERAAGWDASSPAELALDQARAGSPTAAGLPPWWQPLECWLPLLAGHDWRAQCTQAAQQRAIRTLRGLPLQFTAANDAGATAYESHVAATGRVPSRDNAHDRCNALMWLAWPRTKAALNQRQAQQLARHGVRAQRGKVRDAATLIDESGLLLVCADTTLQCALAARNWQAALIDARPRWGRDVAAYVFGHALLDQLAAPYKSLTAAVVPLVPPLSARSPAQIDAAAAAFVQRPDLAPASLQHLPVLGIPGWCAANADPAFYADGAVFRPPGAAPGEVA